MTTLVTLADGAALVEVSVRTARSWVAAGLLVAVEQDYRARRGGPVFLYEPGDFPTARVAWLELLAARRRGERLDLAHQTAYPLSRLA